MPQVLQGSVLPFTTRMGVELAVENVGLGAEQRLFEGR